MASDLSFVEYVVGQFAADCAATHRKVLGEFGLYSAGTFFGVICDYRLFVKPTDGGRAFIGNPVEAPPYPGAKPSFLIEDQLEDTEWLSELLAITVRERPLDTWSPVTVTAASRSSRERLRPCGQTRMKSSGRRWATCGDGSPNWWPK